MGNFLLIPLCKRQKEETLTNRVVETYICVFNKWERSFFLVSVFLSVAFCILASEVGSLLSFYFSFFGYAPKVFSGLYAGSQSMPSPVLTYPSEIDGVPKISLPVFGLAYYKFKPSLWIPNGGAARQLLNSLLQAAENWLALLQVNHPDFLFFCRR